ncbi:hypothetical protein DITRI_Ditri09bG0124800 [Diplodiscus trichospermus]
MSALQNSVPSIHHTLFLNSFSQKGLQKHHHGAFLCCKRRVSVHVRAEPSSSAAASSSSTYFQDSCGRRQMIAAGITAPLVSITDQTPIAFAAETKKGFIAVTDKKDGYSFLYPFGWQEVVIEGQDKVFKDVIEPLESASVNLIPTGKQDIRDFGSPQEVAETLIKKVLAPPTQKTKLIEAAEVCFLHFLLCHKAGFVTLANIWLIMHFIDSSFPTQPGLISLPFILYSLLVFPLFLSYFGTQLIHLGRTKLKFYLV